MQRLKGEPLLDLDQNRASLAPRLRRPSLLGLEILFCFLQMLMSTYTYMSYINVIWECLNVTIFVCSRRSATYTHRFSSSITAADVDETLLNSQETFVSDVLSPTRGGVLPDATVTKNSPRVRVPGGFMLLKNAAQLYFQAPFGRA